MFPVSDDNTRVRRVPVVSYGLIALNVLVFLLELSGGDQFASEQQPAGKIVPKDPVMEQ